MRLINADKLRAWFESHSVWDVFSNGYIMGLIDEQPTVDAEPVRQGNWKPFDEDEYTCSLCGNIFVTMDGEHPLSNGFKFCPFCGAKMDERKEE